MHNYACLYANKAVLSAFGEDWPNLNVKFHGENATAHSPNVLRYH